jgi:acetylornithine deacetylase/succinyl-diaminopimelate desuccinylase-like protein
LGINPHFNAALFLQSLHTLALGQDNALGPATVAPTLYRTDQVSPNVIPGQVNLTLDWRNVPHESPEEIVNKTQALLDACTADETVDPNTRAVAMVSRKEYTTYTGMVEMFPSIFPSYLLPENDRFVQAAHGALVEALGRDDGVQIWHFATDGGHLMQAGIPTVGFGPGNEKLAHTNQERISLAQMQEALVGYVALILALANAAQSD